MAFEPMQKVTNSRADVSIEQDTERVPKDGKFYVLRGSEVIGVFRTMREARRKYEELVPRNPRATKPKTTVRELMEADMLTKSNKELLWTPEDYQRVQRKTWGKGNVR